MKLKSILSKLTTMAKEEKANLVKLGIFTGLLALAITFPKIMGIIGAAAAMIWIDKGSEGHKSLSFLKVPLTAAKVIRDDLASLKADKAKKDAVKESPKAEVAKTEDDQSQE